MIVSSLPRWVGTGAFALALIAGMVNAVGFLAFEHQAITHLTGTTTMFGVALAQGQGRIALNLLLFLLSFIAGAAASGAIVRNSTLRLGRRYGVALMLESLLLLLAIPLLRAHSTAGICIATAACGLQNAMASTYSGAVLRTTHVSGIFTDLGIMLGQRLGGHGHDPQRRNLYLLIVAGFTAGAVCGAAGFGLLAERVLLIPALLTGAVGLAYAIYHHRVVRRGA
ncbi:YoaK family protein [Tahibacter caeni]|uniref:YoaK family protein n=1 Tax=Tahibacter caeni TaxID=1453545 RepID=UPI0027D240E4|nr:YoaK family protein [Tahibacter caeni]